MRSSKNIVYILLIISCLSGCTILSNLDGIFTLQDYSHEKDAQHRQVKIINDHYDALTKAIEQGHIKDYQNESEFVRAFGLPVSKKDLSDGRQRWLYRYAIYRFAKDKVYLYFNPHGRLIKWERLSCSKLF